MDTAAQWPQDVGLMKAMDEVRSGSTCNRGIVGERRASRPQPQEQVKCPRCKSCNTKFCYYNNYSLTQPRYFCKGCRRYWTEGGSLRNVPVGGGSRKNNKRPSYNLPDLNPPHQNPNPNNNYKTSTVQCSQQDLNLSFQEHHRQANAHDHQQRGFIQLAKMEKPHETNNPSSSSSSALDLLRTGIASRGLGSFIPASMQDSNTLYSSASTSTSVGFTLQEFKPPTQALSFRPVEAHIGNDENDNNGGTGGRLFFPFWDFNKQLAGTTDADQDKGQGSTNPIPNTYWNGVLHGGGGSW